MSSQRKLIEGALLLEDINKASPRNQWIRMWRSSTPQLWRAPALADLQRDFIWQPSMNGRTA